MKRRTIGLSGIGLLLAAVVIGTAGVAFAWGPTGSVRGLGPGSMLRGSVQSGYGPGSMMGVSGPGGMMGGYDLGTGGMMQGRGTGIPNQPTTSLDQAQRNAQAYVDRTGNSDLALDEVMEFQGNFYAIVKEKSTGFGAFELLINKWKGAVMPEPGPNMMWNSKYGMMSQTSGLSQAMGYPSQTGPMTVATDQAKQIAQTWLDQNQPGSTFEIPDQFYGYFTVHTLKDGKVTGMLSVNGYTGQVWYHTWHGTFIQLRDLGR